MIYPPECARLIEDFRPVSAAWAAAAGVTLDDVRQELARAWLAGEDPRGSVPRALGLRKIGAVWRSEDLAVVARAAELDPEAEPACEMPTPKPARGHLTAAIMADAGGKIGRRAAQKRLKRARELAQRQGDLFGGASE